MSIETYNPMEREEITVLELSTDKLVDVALKINYAQGFDLNLHSTDVDNVASPTIKLSDVKHHASLLSNFLLTTLYILVLMRLLVPKLVGSLDKIIVANMLGNTKDL